LAKRSSSPDSSEKVVLEVMFAWGRDGRDPLVCDKEQELSATLRKGSLLACKTSEHFDNSHRILPAITTIYQVQDLTGDEFCTPFSLASNDDCVIRASDTNQHKELTSAAYMRILQTGINVADTDRKSGKINTLLASPAAVVSFAAPANCRMERVGGKPDLHVVVGCPSFQMVMGVIHTGYSCHCLADVTKFTMRHFQPEHLLSLAKACRLFVRECVHDNKSIPGNQYASLFIPPLSQLFDEREGELKALPTGRDKSNEFKETVIKEVKEAITGLPELRAMAAKEDYLKRVVGMYVDEALNTVIDVMPESEDDKEDVSRTKFKRVSLNPDSPIYHGHRVNDFLDIYVLCVLCLFYISSCISVFCTSFQLCATCIVLLTHYLCRTPRWRRWTPPAMPIRVRTLI
jgi:hypothetical protein